MLALCLMFLATYLAIMLKIMHNWLVPSGIVVSRTYIGDVAVYVCRWE